jgi:3-oxoacyl-[acyl-carrier protein] reductase
MEQNKGLALVTGANGALGNAIALALGQAGYETALHYHLHKERAAAACATIKACGGIAFLIQADLTKTKSLDKLFAKLEASQNPLVILINNAACLSQKPLFLQPGTELYEMTALNQLAAYECLQRAARIMCRQNKGRIVNTGSLSEWRPMQGQTGYSMTKAALGALTRSAALELGRFGITVNTLAPGPVAGEGLFAQQGSKKKKIIK